MARLTMVAPPELAVGYRLAGTDVVAVTTANDAEHVLSEMVSDPEVGVIGVAAGLFSAIDPSLRHRLQNLVSPVVVAVPEGVADGTPSDHRARLASLLQRAIGFRISFEEESQ